MATADLNKNLKNFIPNKWVQEVGQATFPEKGLRGLNWKGKIKFRLELQQNEKRLNKFYSDAIKNKQCHVGPFYGEFGNFLLHYLPFVAHLHSLDIKVNVLCAEKFKPFFKDDLGNPIFNIFFTFPNVQLDSPPSGNSLKVIPKEYQNVIDRFFLDAKTIKIPALDIGSNNLYWYSYRNWQLNGRQKFYNIGMQITKKNKVVLFPRKKGSTYTQNNGASLNYSEIANLLSNYFDEVAIIGQPDMSDNTIVETDKIKIKLGNNDDVYRETAEAQLIVSQHSGAVHVGLFTNTPALIIFKGILPIKGLDDTIRFRANNNIPIYLVTSEDLLKEFLVRFVKK